MSDFSGYGQFCPVAKASEILAKRWTPLIVRELTSGSTGFNEIHRGVPLMSRPLLAQRLRELIEEGVVNRSEAGAYELTEAGHALEPVIRAMGLWGQRWVESEANGPDWDAGVLMWDMRRRIDTDALPFGRTVLQFDFRDTPAEMRWWWLLIEDDSVDLCISDPGHEVDLYITTTVRVLGSIWIGKRALAPAIERDEICLQGSLGLSRSINHWLMLSALAQESGLTHEQ